MSTPSVHGSNVSPPPPPTPARETTPVTTVLSFVFAAPDFDDEILGLSQEQVRAPSPSPSAPVRVTPQWATPDLLSKPGAGTRAATKLMEQPPPPPSKPVASALSRQAMKEDADALDGMLQGGHPTADGPVSDAETHLQDPPALLGRLLFVGNVLCSWWCQRAPRPTRPPQAACVPAACDAAHSFCERALPHCRREAPTQGCKGSAQMGSATPAPVSSCEMSVQTLALHCKAVVADTTGCIAWCPTSSAGLNAPSASLCVRLMNMCEMCGMVM